METRYHIYAETFEASPERMFESLVTPSAICGWWGCTSATVTPPDGVWSAVWGSEESPDYMNAYTIEAFEPPERILLANGKYVAKTGQPTFEMSMTTEFTVAPENGGCLLRVVQGGFPLGPEADDFFSQCEQSWKYTFSKLRRYLSGYA